MEEQKFEAKSLKHLKKLLEDRYLSDGRTVLSTSEAKKAMIYIDAAQESVNTFMIPFKEKVDELKEEHERELRSKDLTIELLKESLEAAREERHKVNFLLHQALRVRPEPDEELPTLEDFGVAVHRAHVKLQRDDLNLYNKYLKAFKEAFEGELSALMGGESNVKG